jgi:hypothetical protein
MAASLGGSGQRSSPSRPGRKQCASSSGLTLEHVRQPGSHAPDRTHPVCEPAQPFLPPEPQCDLHRHVLICLDSDFLGEHDVASGEPAFGHEAPATEWRIELEDVLLSSFLDAVALACLGAHDFEASMPLVLGKLLGGEPFAQEDPGFGTGGESLSRQRRPGGANANASVTFARPYLIGIGHLPPGNQPACRTDQP